MIILEESEKKQIIQSTIDRLLYCKGFKEELELLIAHYDPNKEVKMSTNPQSFKFDLDKAIP